MFINFFHDKTEGDRKFVDHEGLVRNYQGGGGLGMLNLGSEIR